MDEDSDLGSENENFFNLEEEATDHDIDNQEISDDDFELIPEVEIESEQSEVEIVVEEIEVTVAVNAVESEVISQSESELSSGNGSIYAG